MLHAAKRAWRTISGRPYQSHHRFVPTMHILGNQEQITMNTNPDPKTFLPPVKFHLGQRIQEIYHELKPPVNNKLISEEFLKIMIVGGPNQRSDYHIEMGEELFYQIKGHMHLEIIHPVTRQPHRIQINEGEVFLLPRGIPHSPQRFENTIGLVVERERSLNEMDCMRWYHHPPASGVSPEATPKVWYEEYFYCANLGKQLKPVIQRFLDFKTQQEQRPSPNPPYFTPSSSTSSPLYFSNQDQLLDQSSAIQRLNDLPYSLEVQAQSLRPLNIAEAIKKSLSGSSHRSSPSLSSSPSLQTIFSSEFVFQVLSAQSGLTVSFPLPENCSSKEFLFFQFRGNSQVKKTPFSAAAAHSQAISLKEGEVMLLQDRESNLQQLEFQLDQPEAVVWCIYNTAYLD